MSGPGPCPSCPHGKGFNCPHCWPRVPTPPLGMVEVSKETFFGVLGPTDVNPVSAPDYTAWRDRRGREYGRTQPGYRHPMEARRYYLLKPLLEKTE